LLNFADLLLVDESFTTALLLCQATVLFSWNLISLLLFSFMTIFYVSIIGFFSINGQSYSFLLSFILVKKIKRKTLA
jgi:hypothetical protein